MEKVYRYTPIVPIYIPVLKITCVKEHTFSVPILEYFMYFGSYGFIDKNEKSEKSEKVDKDQETEVKGIIRQFF
jgi:hypothetical protein